MRRFRQAAAKLEGLPGLVGTFRGVRRRGGRWTAEETLTCLVRRKWPRAAGSRLRRGARDERIPARIDGVATDVVAVGRLRLHAAAGGRLHASYDDRGRKSAVSALVAHPDGGAVALGSGHGLLPLDGGAYVAGSWAAGAREVRAFPEAGAAPGSLWFGDIGDDTDFGVVRFPGLAAHAALDGHVLAKAPIAVAPRVRKHDVVQHLACRRGCRIAGRIVADAIPDRPIRLRSEEGIDIAYQDVIAVAGEGARFSMPTESGSLVFDEHRRAIGFVVGGGRDPDDPALDVTFVLRDFAALREGLGDLYPLFFARGLS